jgi:predicted NAD-dependent protein-ADP-ribosyltransferase YbiA (DUF1768 family)
MQDNKYGHRTFSSIAEDSINLDTLFFPLAEKYANDALVESLQ